VGQRDVTVIAIKQLDAEIEFKRAQLHAQGRLGKSEPPGGTSKVQFFRCRHKVSQLAEIHIIQSSYQLGPKNILDVSSKRYQPARVMMIEAR
jgi:hypothetical protein